MEDENRIEDGELQAHRAYLLRYASLQLRNPSVAEDAVQDALVAALAARRQFAGRSAVRTWLVGILKHKIVDAIRKQSREVPVGRDEEMGATDAVFKSDGHWQEVPADWGDPEQSLGRKEFYAALEACLAKLPKRTGQAFMMREHLGAPTDEICKVLEITPTHCWVLLHRARLALRECLQQNWFAGARK